MESIAQRLDNAPAFIFGEPVFNFENGALRLPYAFAGGASFEEVIIFPMPAHISAKQEAAFMRAIRLIHYLAGVSYYKAFVPNSIQFEGGSLDDDTAHFLQKIYTQGLGEFAFENGIDIRAQVKFSCGGNGFGAADILGLKRRALVPVGGGKDSVVSIEALKQSGHDITLFAVGGPKGAAQPIADCMRVSGLSSLYVSRTLDAGLKDLNAAGAFNGHIPITAIISAIAVATAILHDYDAVILSNEHSASAPNVVVDDFDVNHQYSKSLAFEQDFAEFVKKHIASDVNYFSLLRPFSEAMIAKNFAKHMSYHSVFRSCNTAFKQDASKRGTHWCCDCPKCRFVFLALAPFTPKAELISIFGQNMLDDDSQIHGFKQLCGLVDFKPFECVGEVEESALLMQAISQMDAWKDDAVVKACAQNAPNFEARFKDLLAPKTPHNVPDDYKDVLHALS